MIGIIGAMNEEIEKLQKDMTIDSEIVRANITYYKGTLYGCDCVVCKSGIGKVNMALCTQLLIDNFFPDLIINTGVAGAIDDELEIGDIVISTQAIEHDVDITALGYKKSVIPDLDTSVFDAQSGVAELAYNIANGILKDAHVTRGLIATGDQFISSKEGKDSLHKEYDCLCAEMEGAAMAHVAHVNNIPFVIIRAISDQADELAVDDYPAFVDKATSNIVCILSELLPNLNQ